MAVDAYEQASPEQTLSGLDRLQLGQDRRRLPLAMRVWASSWPKLAAIGLAMALWQAVAWSGWKPPWVLPGPAPVLTELAREAGTAGLWQAMGTTMSRAVLGFAVAVLAGLVLGMLVARWSVLRAGLGSMITAIQTMPSIAWFPLAMLLFGLSENAILFVVVLGAAPSIVGGVLAGVDYVPALWLRAGRNLGARGASLYRYVIAPAALPAILAGLRQGWAFAWRSLMAGELLVNIAYRPALGVRLDADRQLNDAVGMIATMIVILVIGLAVNAGFAAADHALRRRWGIKEASS